MSFRNHRVGSWLGALSVALAAVPIVYIFQADSFPHHALTETVILLGGGGGSVVAALGAGVVGSRWWFLATLAAAVDVVCLWGFSP